MSDRGWYLDDPTGALDAWIELDHPDEYLRRAVTVWLVAFDDPFIGDRDPLNSAAWSAVAATVPPAADQPESVVLVAYRISPREQRITVDFIATVSWPVVP